MQLFIDKHKGHIGILNMINLANFEAICAAKIEVFVLDQKVDGQSNVQTHVTRIYVQ